MVGARFWLRWSWRDLRKRWLQVVATALVIGIGTGTYAGLGGLRTWREKSNDASFAALHYHDLRVDLSEGSYVPRGRLRLALAGLRERGTVAQAEERLVVPTQVDATRGGQTVLVPGRLVGVPLGGGGPRVDAIEARAGRTLGPADAGRRVAVLEWNFADHYGMPASGRIRLAGPGGGSVRYVGQGLSPQYFLVAEQGGWGGEANLAIVFMPLRAAQAAAGRPGQVNQALVTLPPGVPAGRAEREVSGALEAALPGLGVKLTRGSEEGAYRILYRDARNDQQLYNVFAILLLAGASLAAFNLISRVVEAQRREIGIGMALGVEPRALAIRPFLMGAEIALLGVVFGVGMGFLSAELLKGVMRDVLPLPRYAGAFQASRFALAAAAGFILPLAATAYPVWRGVRVTPIEAIRVGFRSARGGRLVSALKRVAVPGRSLAQMPVRNVARTPRRTLMTLMGLGVVVAVIVALTGMVDTFRATADRSSAEVLRSTPSRLVIGLDGFAPADSPRLALLASSPLVSRTEPQLSVGAELRSRRKRLDASLTFVDPRSRMWRPTVTEGTLAPGSRGIVIARKAADDLGVQPGDTVELRHPVRRGRSFDLVTTRVRVAGVHANPLRFYAYMDAGQAARLGLGGVVNTVSVTPAPGVSGEVVSRALFGRAGVASVQPAGAATKALRQTVEDFTGAIRFTSFFALFLALLIAFNSTSIAVDERAREYATMFAFGVPVRTGLRIAMVESLITGVLGTLVGIGMGLAMLGWIVHALVPRTFPDLGAVPFLSTSSIVLAAVVGIGAVALAPLLMVRRLRRMDIPAALRVVE